MPNTGNEWIVAPDKSRFARVALAIGPVSILPCVALTIMLVAGRRTSEGLGAAALPAVLVLVGLPLIWYVTYATLHTLNSYVCNVAGAIWIRDWMRRVTVIEEPSFLVRTLINSSGGNGELLIVGDADTAVLLNPRQWREAHLKLVWRAVGLKEQFSADTPKPRTLQERYPTLRLPLYLRFPGLFYTFWTIVVVLYIGVVINVFARL